MERPLLEHLAELRKRLLLIVVSFIVLFFAGFYAGDPVIALAQRLASDISVTLITTSPLEYILVQIKVASVLAIACTAPIVVYQSIMFVRPGLTLRERSAVAFILPATAVLFLMGVVFSLFIVVPVTLVFFQGMAADAGIQNLWSLDSLVGYVLFTTLGLGLVFEVPIIVLLMNQLGILPGSTLSRYRPYIYVATVAITAYITPMTDMVSLIIISVPLLLLLELSILLTRLVGKG
jgi:sec-independent protein translocase protein TatC